MKKIFILILLLIICSGCAQVDKLKEQWAFVKKISEKIRGSNISLDLGSGKHVVIVPGYGAPVQGNPGYEGYIKKVADFVKSNKVDIIVFTGGYSSLKDTSEASSMSSYFNALNNSDNITIYKEECAIVSWQNISNSKNVIAEHNVKPSRITIFGDEARKEKLVAYASYAFNENQNLSKTNSGLDISLSYTDIDFIGYDFGTDENEQKEKIAAEMAGAYDVKVGNEILKKRINDWSDKFKYNVAHNLVNKGCIEFKGFQ